LLQLKLDDLGIKGDNVPVVATALAFPTESASGNPTTAEPVTILPAIQEQSAQ
jgi:hypothetical protein